jgi:UDP-N-acetylmuramate dehydrogenase
VSGRLATTIQSRMDGYRGRLQDGQMLADVTWFRVGGPAEVLAMPVDEADLALLMRAVPEGTPVTIIGLGSNLLVRDGGIRGVVIRLGRGFQETRIETGNRIRVGTAVPDVKLARAAADAGLSGLEFYRGIPGCVGGALRMNAGAHGRETKDTLIEVRAVDRRGTVHTASLAELGMTYRHCGAPADWIFTEALYQGAPGDQAAILKTMDEVAQYREANQPIKERTGGSTFKNPPGRSAWRQVDEAGCRGFRVGGAKVSEMHCNFLINDQGATAEDVEQLGETVRARVKETSGVVLEWEIIRLGEPLPGHAVGESLALPRHTQSRTE